MFCLVSLTGRQFFFIYKLKMNNVTSSRSTPLTTRTMFDQNSEQTGMEPIQPFSANQLSHRINVCDIVCVCKV